jgi:hypothetical protein
VFGTILTKKDDADKETKTSDNATIYYNFCRNELKNAKMEIKKRVVRLLQY